MEGAEVNRYCGLINSYDALAILASLFLRRPAAMKQVLSHRCRRLVLFGRHRSSEISHQRVIEFFFLFGALIVTPGLCVLLLLFFVRVGGATGLLVACGRGGCLVLFGFIGSGKSRDGCRQSCDGKYADQSGFHESFSFYYLHCMKASRDGLALYTMQNWKGERLFRGAEEKYFRTVRNKAEFIGLIKRHTCV
jgi:hypothetical protein